MNLGGDIQKPYKFSCIYTWFQGICSMDIDEVGNEREQKILEKEMVITLARSGAIHQ
jgi:hypothetical protein